MLRLPGDVQATVVVRGEQTDDAFTMLVDRLPPGWSLPPHRHAAETETILLTSGRLRMRVGAEERELAAGESVVVPASVLHDGSVVGDEPVERVVVFSPAGMERFFEALAATSTTDEALALAVRHGWRFE